MQERSGGVGDVDKRRMNEAEAQGEQALGTCLSDRAEQEEGLIDGQHLEGLPEDEQKRRAEWLKLPRATRASMRRLHTMLLHKPMPVMIQILKLSLIHI